MLKQKRLIKNVESCSVDPIANEIPKYLAEYSFPHVSRDGISGLHPIGGSEHREENEVARILTLPASEELPSGSTSGDSTLLTAATATASPSTSSSEAHEAKEKIARYLNEMHLYRQNNELIVGFSEGRTEKQIGLRKVGSVESENIIQGALESTVGYSYLGDSFFKEFDAAEFAISYDNKIFLYPLSNENEDDNGQRPLNHLTIGYGTFLKAVGLIQIGEGQIKYISSYSSLFDTKPSDILQVLAVFDKAGFNLKDTQIIIPDKKKLFVFSQDSNCEFAIQGWIKKFSDYCTPEADNVLEMSHYPGVKARAEAVDLTIVVRDIFLMIDNELLQSRHLPIILSLQPEKQKLKEEIVQLVQAQGIEECAYCYDLICKRINRLEKKAKFDLVRGYLLSLFLWKFHGGKLNNKQNQEIENWLISLEGIPAQTMTHNKAFVPFFAFYDKNPIMTCIALLRDYTKGTGSLGRIKRILSGAWNRNNIEEVNQFLSVYDQGEFLDDLTICDIFTKIRGYRPIASPANFSKGTLRARLLFCALLNNESDRLHELLSSRVNEENPAQEANNHQVIEVESVSENPPELPINENGSQCTTPAIMIDKTEDKNPSQEQSQEHSPTGHVGSASSASSSLFKRRAVSWQDESNVAADNLSHSPSLSN